MSDPNNVLGRSQEEQLRARMLEDGLLDQIRLGQQLESSRRNIGVHSGVTGNGGFSMDTARSLSAAGNQLLSRLGSSALGSSALSPLLNSSLSGGLGLQDRHSSVRNDLLALSSASNPLLLHQNQQIALSKQLLAGGLGGWQQRELGILQQNPLLTSSLLRETGRLDSLNSQLLSLHEPHVNPSFSASAFTSASADSLKVSGKRGVIEPFPEKLHRLLRECEATGNDDIISFTADGKAFQIHKPDRFFSIIVPRYFKQSKLSSFKRQLNLYRFELITIGPSRGGYAHPNFQKYKPELCRQIRRRDIKPHSKDASKEDTSEKVKETVDEKTSDDASESVSETTSDGE